MKALVSFMVENFEWKIELKKSFKILLFRGIWNQVNKSCEYNIQPIQLCIFWAKFLYSYSTNTLKIPFSLVFCGLKVYIIELIPIWGKSHFGFYHKTAKTSLTSNLFKKFNKNFHKSIEICYVNISNSDSFS